MDTNNNQPRSAAGANHFKPLLDNSTTRFIATAGGFYERYIQNLPLAASNRAAYELTEQQYTAICGQSRYCNHESFKAAYTQYHRRRTIRKAGLRPGNSKPAK